jgi:hypothetical protein
MVVLGRSGANKGKGQFVKKEKVVFAAPFTLHPPSVEGVFLTIVTAGVLKNR